MTHPDTPKAGGPGLARFLPLIIVAGVAALIFATGLNRYLSLEALKENHGALAGFVGERYALAALAFVGVYIAATSASLPGAAFLSLAGGLMFGAVAGTGLIVIGATIGAIILFIAAKSALGASILERAGPTVKRMEEGFRENAFSYLLILRLVPLFPFFLVNIAPAAFNMKLRDFALATFIGIIPGAFAYASAGAGLGAVIEKGGEVSLDGLLTDPKILTPIVALSLLAILPIVLKRLGVIPSKKNAA
jgi:uncharacterized membrane protein YdjX (TVP38/TMEM64 family)